MPSYSNGYIPDNLLITFKTGWNSAEGTWEHKLSPGTYEKHLNLVSLAKRNTGGNISITDGWGAYRPYASQVYARSLYGNGAAWPGTSSHGGFWEGKQTLAIDYNWGPAYGWNRAAWFRDVRAVGLTPGLIHPSRGNNYPDEPWHVVDLDPWRPVSGGNAAPGTEPVEEPEEDEEDEMATNVMYVTADPKYKYRVGIGNDVSGLWVEYVTNDGGFNTKMAARYKVTEDALSVTGSMFSALRSSHTAVRPQSTIEVLVGEVDA